MDGNRIWKLFWVRVAIAIALALGMYAAFEVFIPGVSVLVRTLLMSIAIAGVFISWDCAKDYTDRRRAEGRVYEHDNNDKRARQDG